MGYRTYYDFNLEFDKDISHMQQQYEEWHNDEYEGFWVSDDFVGREFSGQDETKQMVEDILSETLKWFADQGIVCKEGYVSYNGEEDLDVGRIYVRDGHTAFEYHSEDGIRRVGRIPAEKELEEKYKEIFNVLKCQVTDTDLTIEDAVVYANRPQHVCQTMVIKNGLEFMYISLEIDERTKESFIAFKKNDIHSVDNVFEWQLDKELFLEDIPFSSEFVKLFLYMCKKQYEGNENEKA